MVDKNLARDLVQPSTIRASSAVAGDWLLIAINLWMVIQFPHPVTWVAGFLLAARHQLALAILMHDGSHRRLARSAKVNDWLSQWLCAAPLFFSMYSYQSHHLKHHREPLAADDPDLSLIGGYPIARKSLMRKLLRDASGISYFKFIGYFIHRARKRTRASSGPRPPKAGKMPFHLVLTSMLVVNFAIWAVLWWSGHPWTYLFFWVLPMMTGLQVLLRIRGIAEHAGYTVNPDQSQNARTVVNPIQTFFFAPHNVNYHIEHHLFPAVPFYRLPELHQRLLAANAIPLQNIYNGYGKVLRELTREN